MKNNRLFIIIPIFTAICMLLMPIQAYADTEIYVGDNLTDQGETIIGRSEDDRNCKNKLFYVSPAGNHKSGEKYEGCYGYNYTFTHDSYGYTAFRDDNGGAVDHICPDCEQTHNHTPYEAAGTNDQGVTVTASVSIGNEPITLDVDPFSQEGISEAEITTILLSESATARQALKLLINIYDMNGAAQAAGILIADNKEIWYIENEGGHQFIALKLPSTMVFVQPDISIVGEIDLDDTDNVITSPKLIETAEKNGTFVGDKKENRIHYSASYAGEFEMPQSMYDALEYLGQDNNTDFLLSNVDKDGNIVPIHTGIKLNKKLTIEDIQDFYRTGDIGRDYTVETHIFQIDPAGGETGTVEWVAMDDPSLSIFVPYYPMLTEKVYSGYKTETALPKISNEQEEDIFNYPARFYRTINGEKNETMLYVTPPENWRDSMYWSLDVLSNLYLYKDFDQKDLKAIDKALQAQQKKVNESFAQFTKGDITKNSATNRSMKTAEEVHALVVKLTETYE